MKQVTGSNPTSITDKVSIQLPLDGLLFIGDSIPNCKVEDGGVVEVELLTAKSIIVPGECFEPALADSFLRLSGIDCSEVEQPVWSSDCDGVIALMVIRRDIESELKRRLGEKIQYTSPLLRSVKHCEDRYLYIYSAYGVAYFKLYEGSDLKFCEAVSVAGNDEVLYFVERIIQEYHFEGLKIRVDGDNIDSLTKLLKQYYKVEVCE